GLTARENLMFLAAFRGHVASDVAEALRKWGLKDEMDRPIERLSAGQRRRASLARIETEQVPLVLLDEPFADLDSDALVRLRVARALDWIAILFAATLVATRSFARELEDDAIDAVLMLDGGREALYAGKLIAIAIVLAIVALAAALLSLVLLDLGVALAGHLVLVGVLGILALPPVIVLVTLLALRVRARVALVPILSFPVLMPQLAACTQGAAAALAGDAAASLGWAGILAAFRPVYGALGLAIVPAAIE